MMPTVMTYLGYQGTVEVSLEDNSLHGKILHINDLITYEAETPAQVEAEFKAAVDDYLEFCAAEGKAADKPYKGSFNIRIGEDLHKEATLLATQLGCALNDFVKEAIRDRVCRGAGNVAQTIVQHRHVQHINHYSVQTGFSESYSEESQQWNQKAEAAKATLQ